MKRQIITFVILLAAILAHGQCPTYGDATDPDDKVLNTKKNRSVNVSKKPTKVLLENILKPGNDTTRFNDSMYVEVTGYVIEVVKSGKESCNCDSSSYMNTDIHVYVGQKDAKSKAECFVVEISPKAKKKLINQFKEFSDWRNLETKQVKFTGWMMFDVEHKGNAANTCKKCTNVWRKTIWEIHPVTKVEIIK